MGDIILMVNSWYTILHWWPKYNIVPAENDDYQMAEKGLAHIYHNIGTKKKIRDTPHSPHTHTHHWWRNEVLFSTNNYNIITTAATVSNFRRDM